MALEWGVPVERESLAASLKRVYAQVSARSLDGAGGPVRGDGTVPLAAIDGPTANPRTRFDATALAELAASIQEYGVLQPVLLLRRGSRYEILAGERRWRAAHLAGLERIPAVVRDEDDAARVAEIRLIENIQREDLDPIELALAYRHLLDDHQIPQEELATRLGISRSNLANTLRLLSLPPAVQEMLRCGALSAGHARALIGLPRSLAEDLAGAATAEGWSVRQTEGQAQAVKRGATTAPATGRTTRSGKAAHLRELEGNLSRLFDADVLIHERDGQGRLLIRFHSKGHFQAIVEELIRAANASQRPRS